MSEVATDLANVIYEILESAYDRRQAKLLEQEAKRRGANLEQMVAAAIAQAILEQYRLTPLAERDQCVFSLRNWGWLEGGFEGG